MNGLDPEGPIVSLVFDAPESDTVIKAVDRAGLRVDWNTDELTFSTNKLRKRLFRGRVAAAVKELSDDDRFRFLSQLAATILELNIATLDQLNRALGPVGWLYEGELVRLVQGPTNPDAVKPVGNAQRTAVIVTALALEADAVRAHLADVKEEVHDQGTVYFVGNFDADVKWRVAFLVAGQGNQTAAAEVERAIVHFKPQVILLVGIAGALKDLNLGDVVAADKIYGYERGKAADEFLPRPSFGLSTYPLIQRAQAEAMKAEWIQKIKPNAPDRAPTAVVAPIAAGEKVVASMDSPEFKALRKYTSDAVAVEMEGAGFLAGAHMNHGVNALVVRGISDRIEGKGEADAGGSQPRAASHAAAFAFQCLANFQ